MRLYSEFLPRLGLAVPGPGSARERIERRVAVSRALVRLVLPAPGFLIFSVQYSQGTAH